VSQENVELHFRANDAFNRRDMDALLAFMDTDVEFVSRLVPMEGHYHGHGGIRRWWDVLLDTLPDFAIEVVEVRDPGDLTVATVRTRGHGAGSDNPLDETVWQVVRWRRGKCAWWRNFHTRAEALEAVGLSEQEAQAGS
jgi:ketosteroid isomerase-like protein